MRREDYDKILELRHELHAHPELSLNENETKKRLIKFLAANTTLAIVDCGGWFYAARYLEGTPAIAFRADMDALPIDELNNNLSYSSQAQGVSHKCGHDGHCAVLCGLALELEKLEPHRSCYLIFQHAEEIGQGAKVCAKFLDERNITEIYAFHNLSGWPEGSVITRKGLCQLASEGLTIKFIGRASHASEPEKGVNPAYAIAQLIIYIKELLNLNQEILCTPVNINLGAKNFGISPGEGEVSFTLRAASSESINLFAEKICAKAQELAAIYKIGKYSCEIFDYFTETVSESWCVEQVNRAADKLGLMRLDMPEPWRASEDFGYYTQRRSGAIFYIGNGESWPALHTCSYDFNDNIIANAVNVFLELYKN
ncbi:MAG: amidohydrolase [Synergistaceae bacterium]|nr:amidohydrolase [Synergistaceae bacterium]